MTPAPVLLDAADRPLLPIWTHLDRPACPAARQVWQAVGQEFLETTGNRPLPGGISAVCFRQMPSPTHPIALNSYPDVNGYLALRLTDSGPSTAATPASPACSACSTYDCRCRGDQLPGAARRLVPGDETIGTILPSAAAAELGLPPGLPVKLGAGQHQPPPRWRWMTDAATCCTRSAQLRCLPPSPPVPARATPADATAGRRRPLCPRHTQPRRRRGPGVAPSTVLSRPDAGGVFRQDAAAGRGAADAWCSTRPSSAATAWRSRRAGPPSAT